MFLWSHSYAECLAIGHFNKHRAVLSSMRAVGKGRDLRMHLPISPFDKRTFGVSHLPQVLRSPVVTCPHLRTPLQQCFAFLFVALLSLLIPQLCQVFTGPEPLVLCVCAHGVKGLKDREEYLPFRKWSLGRAHCSGAAPDCSWWAWRILSLRWPGSRSITNVAQTLDAVSVGHLSSPCYCLVAHVQSNPSAENLHAQKFCNAPRGVSSPLRESTGFSENRI